MKTKDSVLFHENNKKIQVFKSTTINEELFRLLKSARICVDGNIGSGKTTFIRSLKNYLTKKGISVQSEEENMNNKMLILNLFIENPEKYAFAFQATMLSERLNIYRMSLPELISGKTVLIDRSLVGDYAFAQHHYQEGNINHAEWLAYQEMIQKYSDEEFFRMPDFYLYLSVTPEKCLHRISKRNRPGEKSGYTLEYLEALERSHCFSFSEMNVPFFEIDWNEEVFTDNSGLISDDKIEHVLLTILEQKIQKLVSGLKKKKLSD